MTTMTMKVMAVVGCLFCACGVAAPEDKVDATTCKATFQSPDHIELCHGQSRPGDPYKCTKEWQGFVIEQLVIAPRSQSYTDCGPFHNNDLYGAQCMRDLVHQKEDFDRVVLDILDKVSGQNQIAQSTAVERFSLAGDAAVGDKEMVAVWNSSAFVSFEKKCKPAYPDLSANEATMINMCTNRTVNESRVYLTLRNTSHVPETRSMCRCTIRPTVSVKLLALDVRLQTATNHSCGSTSIKIESKDADPRDFECEGMSAWYGSTLLYNSKGEITLTLFPVSAASFPTAVWIEVVEKGDARSYWEPATVSCEGFIPVTDVVPDTVTEVVPDTVTTVVPGTGGADLGIILGAAIGGLFLFVIIIVMIVIVLRRRSDSYSGILPISCGSCCKRNRAEDQPNCDMPAAQTEAVYYSQLDHRHSSTSTSPYTSLVVH